MVEIVPVSTWEASVYGMLTLLLCIGRFRLIKICQRNSSKLEI